MEELKDKSLIDLVNRLNNIEKQIQDLTIEYNKITYELWERIPPLKDDINIQPKILKKVKDER